MTAEVYSATVTSRLDVPNILYPISNGYYRSKIFVTASTSNALVAAAGPLLSLIERLCLSHTLPPIHSIRDNIEHELHAFNSRLAYVNLADELISIANYLLCSTIDELLGKNYLRVNGYIDQFKAFTPCSPNELGPEYRFFEIIDHIKERTNQYLDLIELGYYCLIAGYEGKYHLRADGRQALDNLIEELYQVIQYHRVGKPHRLFKEHNNTLPNPINYKPLVMKLLIALGIVCAAYVLSNIIIEHKAQSLLSGHTALTNMDN